MDGPDNEQALREHGVSSASPEQDSPARPSKRPRVSLACQRCKIRKQKCDGKHPACSNCTRTRSECRYVTSNAPRAAEQRLYTKALEERVAELESSMSLDGREGVAEDHWDHLPPSQDTSNPLSTVIRDLSLHACGLYIGGSSNLSLGRLLGTVLKSRVSSLPLEERETDDRESFANGVDGSTPSQAQEVNHPRPPEISGFAGPEIEMLYEAYIRHVSIQYPLIHSTKLNGMHKRRLSLTESFEICVMHLVYAIGGRTLQFTGKPGDDNSDQHYEAAMESRDTIIQYSDRRSIIYLALATLYCLRAPRQPGPWMMIGLAIKLCISLGLHRKSPTRRLGLPAELDKRLFWTCYYLDRDVTIGSGRPPSISDHDIDVELPLDVNESSSRAEDFRAALNLAPDTLACPPTTLTFFIHTLRMKRISSEVQHEIYRVDRNVNTSHAVIDGFIAQLDSWKARSPIQSDSNGGSSKTPSTQSPTSESYARLHLKDSYMLQYYTCKRLLLFPQLTQAVVDSRYLKLCAEACAGVCTSYKNLHDYSSSICYSPVATQSLFLAGLTLIYCIWHSFDETSSYVLRNAVTDCSIMLYVMTERWPAALKYRNAFERVKRTVFGLLADGKSQTQASVGIMDTETRTALDSLDEEFGGNPMGGFTHMLSEFTGKGPLRGGAGGNVGMQQIPVPNYFDNNTLQLGTDTCIDGGWDNTHPAFDWTVFPTGSEVAGNSMDWRSAVFM
ncbi:hypothetical protein LTR96_009240 [Exophiala xenobiotica]|nr:hypothetical protein LTR96_009240 [Exophiala xenobiotica]KAK5439098.1 hypothetical protein LTR34_000062 [Exophiala xenobiotica]